MSIETVLRFAQLGLAAPILQAIDEIGYETPSPIQARSIPPMLAGRDLLGQAQTGTGKTAAFALPILCRVDPHCRSTQALILTPTRELAIQVAEAIHAYGRHLDGLHVLPVYGGQHIGAQLRPLQRGVHVVVGTPGRIIDHLERGTLRLDEVSTVVLDEADEMLRMGFLEDVDLILDRIPASRQVALFSATMPPEVRRIADRHLRDPEVVTIETATATVAAVRQRYLVAPWRQKLDAMTRILETAEYDAMLVFVRTKVATLELCEKLEARGHACAALNGDMTQALRERCVQRLRDGSLDIVVATDVAARGLDVSRITHVVNYDIPNDTDAYVHRIGRTGRAGREGEAILLVQPREHRLLRAIERATGQLITPMQLPTSAEVTERRVALFRQRIVETIAEEDLGFFDEVLASIRDEEGHPMKTIAAALAFIVQAERPLQEPEEEEAPEDPRDRRRWERERREAGRDPGRGDRRRDERDEAPSRAPAPGPLRQGMAPYRIEVGRVHGAEPRHIVGAITNETGLTGRQIGRIQLHDLHSLVDLPAAMPQPLLERLRDVQIFGRPLLAIAAGAEAEDDRGNGRSAAPPKRSRHEKGARGGKPERFGSPDRDKKHGGGKKHAGKHAKAAAGERPGKGKGKGKSKGGKSKPRRD